MRPNPQETADLVSFTEEIFNGKLHFLCSDSIIGILLIQKVKLIIQKTDAHMKCTKRKPSENHKYQWKHDFYWVVIEI